MYRVFGRSVASAIALNTASYGDHHKKPVDLVGVWNAIATSDDGEREFTWTFVKDGGKITGTTVNDEDGNERNLDRVGVKEKTVTIEIDIERDGDTGIIKVVAKEKESGTLTGKWSIAGSDGAEFMSGDITAVKEVKVAYAGDWQVTSVLPDGNELTAAMILKGENSSLKGSFKGDNNTVEIDKITAKDKSLRLAFDMEIEGSSTDIVIEAGLKEENMLVGQWIVKEADGSEAATGDWSATREAQLDLAGEWNLTAGLPDGGEYAATISVVKEGGKYTGKAKSSDGDETAIKSLSIDGKKVVFTLDFESDGEVGLLTMTAQHREDGSLDGKWSLVRDDGTDVAGDSWSAVKVKKDRGVLKGR